MINHIETGMRLAELLGYTEITPEGMPCWRIYEGLYARDSDGDMSRIPDWVHDNGDAFALMVEHGCYPYETEHGVGIIVEDVHKFGSDKWSSTVIHDHVDKAAAVRYAIVMAVIAKLEAAKVSA